MIRMLNLQEAIDLLGSPVWTKDFGTYCNTLKKNFRKLILKFHQDKANGNKEMEEMGKRIIEANSIIGDAISSGDLKCYLIGEIKEKEKNEVNYTKAQWDEGLYDDISFVTDILVSMLGSMKKLLMNLPIGLHEVYFKGIKFKVHTIETGKIINSEPERIWTIKKGSIHKVKELASDVEPLQLIFGG